MRNFGLVFAAILLSSQAGAATIFKCVDESGKVTFTKNANCPRDTGLEDVVRAHNAAPSGSSAPVRMAAPVANRPAAKNKELVVVGEQPVVPVAQPAETSPRGGIARPQGPTQPCIKIVEKLIHGRIPTKDGKIRSRAQIVKVPVAC